MDALRLLSRSTGLRPETKRANLNATPSQGQNSSPTVSEDTSSRKRKREPDEFNGVHGPSNGDHDLSQEECRQIQNQHKIKIVNLRKLHSTKRTESRKAQKEASRLFPQPLTTFGQLRTKYATGRTLSENVAEQGYYEPTEVQMTSLPLLLDHSADEPNLLTVAPTGSGKTLAFLIPLIEKTARSHRESVDTHSRHASAIILAPTKELVGQIVNEGRKLTARTGVAITAVRKGMKMHEKQLGFDGPGISDEENSLARIGRNSTVKTDILVSTPLSILNAISSDDESGAIPLPDITSLILDEADVLLDPLFRAQTLAVWTACQSRHLRTSLWSATIGSNIEELAVSTIKQRQKSLRIKPAPPLIRIVIGLKDSSLPTITHKLIYAASEPGKLLGLRQLLHPARSAPTSRNQSSTNATSETQPLRPPFLVFTQTIERASALHSELLYDIPAAAGGPSRIAVLHSSLSDTKRSEIMTRFRKGQIWILITTDLLSRGVDFRGVNGVVNYDIPTTSAAYVHRAGRTGRAGRQGGVCVTFYTRDDVKYVKAIANIIAASQKKQRQPDGAVSGESSGLEKWVLDALPDLSKKDRKELKERGVVSRRAIKESDDVKERKMKRKARIGTQSGYEKKLENNRRGAVLGSRRRAGREADSEDDDNDDDGQVQVQFGGGRDNDWGGFGD